MIERLPFLLLGHAFNESDFVTRPRPALPPPDPRRPHSPQGGWAVRAGRGGAAPQLRGSPGQRVAAQRGGAATRGPLCTAYVQGHCVSPATVVQRPKQASG